mgnify:FL=1
MSMKVMAWLAAGLAMVALGCGDRGAGRGGPTSDAATAGSGTAGAAGRTEGPGGTTGSGGGAQAGEPATGGDGAGGAPLGGAGGCGAADTLMGGPGAGLQGRPVDLTFDRHEWRGPRRGGRGSVRRRERRRSAQPFPALGRGTRPSSSARH